MRWRVARLVFVASSLFPLVGCNTLVGTDEVAVDGGDDEGDAGSEASGANGGLSAIAPTTPLNCSFQPTSPGVAENKELPLSLQWQGYAPGSDEVGSVSAADFFDCNGSKGVHVVVYEMAKFFCGACEQDAKSLEARLAKWRAEGLSVVWVTALVTAPDGQGKATTEGAKIWRDKFALEHVHVVADPGYQLLPSGKGTFGTPSFVIVDPRTQKVVKWLEGAGAHDAAIESLAQKNAGL
ncbi:MAG: hypothetical protein FJ095_18325 [Deltaproteobacteria bacterium]|nr:hypothetical protein [Deltaproteobacteria bacterium]